MISELGVKTNVPMTMYLVLFCDNNKLFNIEND